MIPSSIALPGGRLRAREGSGQLQLKVAKGFESAVTGGADKRAPLTTAAAPAMILDRMVAERKRLSLKIR